MVVINFHTINISAMSDLKLPMSTACRFGKEVCANLLHELVRCVMTRAHRWSVGEYVFLECVCEPI